MTRLQKGRLLISSAFQWAWRGVRARGWTAVLSVVLIAVVLAANVLVFSATDALVFNPYPYRDPERLVTLRSSTHPTFLQLRSFADLFSDVHGHLPGATIVTGDRDPVQIMTSFVTPGLFRMLGVDPTWGRTFVEDDVAGSEPPPAVIDDDLARDRFGDPRSAVGRMLPTSDRPLLVIGVMPAGFRFPDGSTRIWRVLDYRQYAGSGVIVQGFPSFRVIARLARGVPLAHAETALVERLPLFRPAPNRTAVTPIRFESTPDARRLALLAMSGAALCLLLIACANVASLELAGLGRRARSSSIQMALGASRRAIATTALLEGAILVCFALALGAAIVGVAFAPLVSWLPEHVTGRGVNPIDLEWRAAAFMAGIAAAAWLFASLPIVLAGRRSSLIDVLRSGDRAASPSRAASVGRWLLAAGQVAFALTLLVTGLLYTRTYSKLLEVETGADTRGVVRLLVSVPRALQPRDLAPDVLDIERRVLERARAIPHVIAASAVRGSVPPDVGYSMTSRPIIDNRERSGEELTAVRYTVDQNFFEAFGIPLRAGRLFAGTDDPASAVISDTMARRFWGDQNPIGRVFRLDPQLPPHTVIGIVGHVRIDADSLTAPGDSAFVFYEPVPPPAYRTSELVHRPADPAAPPAVNVPSGGLAQPFTQLRFVIRIDDAAQLASVLDALRAIDSRVRARAEFLNDVYASRHADTLMATSIITAFAGCAVVVSLTGIYGVMAFLVAVRRREIGIRMALGADQRAIGGMVMTSSAGLVATGIVVGSAAALGSSRLIASQLFGVSPTDVSTYLIAAAAIGATALVATWHPALQAARVDPAVTLRTE
jgi:predicted permease